MEHYFPGGPLRNCKPLNSAMTDDEPETNSAVGFECNICLDLVQDPVVTFCGHLYCWPCIYRWINFQAGPTSLDRSTPTQCPVCKTEVSDETLIPLYGRGEDTTNSSKEQVSSRLIPQRPLSPRCSQLRDRSYAPNYRGYHPVGGRATYLADPMIGVFGEMVYARIFGNSETTMYTHPNSYHLAGSSSPRMRRQMVQIEKSLSRVCFFFCCCAMLCLLLF